MASWGYSLWICLFLGVGCCLGQSCRYTLNKPKGYMKSPGYPKPTTKSFSCFWDVVAKPGQRIHLELHERDFRCSIASLKLDLYITTHFWLDNVIQLCNSYTNEPMVKTKFESGGNKASVTAKRYGTRSLKGFLMTYQFVGCAKADLPKNMIVDNEEDVYDQGFIASLFCDDGFKLQSASTAAMHYRCNEDNVWKRLGQQDTCVEDRCNYELTGPSGEIKSPGYPTPLKDPIPSCVWHVRVEPGQRVHLVVKDRDFRCNVANLTLNLYEGSSLQLCYYWIPKPLDPNEFDSVANEASIYCKKYQSDAQKGFWITYKAVGCPRAELPPGTILNNATVFDHGYVARVQCAKGMELLSGSTAPLEWRCESDNKWILVGKNDTCIRPEIKQKFRTGPKGEIISPDYPGPMKRRVNYSWIVRAEFGQRINFTIEERPLQCNTSTLMLDVFHVGQETQLCLPWDKTPPGDFGNTSFVSVTNGAVLISKTYPRDPMTAFKIKYEAIGCPTTGFPLHMVDKIKLDYYGPKYIVFLQCPEGMRLKSGSHEPVELKCGDDNKWIRMGPDDTCVSSVNCSLPATSIPNGNRIAQIGYNATYMCNYGHFFDESRNVTKMDIHCSTDGVWSDNAPACHYNASCHELIDDHIDNGYRTEYTGHSLGDTSKYRCDYGFFFDSNLTMNSTEIECEPDGTWTVGVPTCLFAITCPAVSHETTNGFIYDVTGFHPRDNATYRCMPGFYGDEERTMTDLSVMCLLDGKWSGEVPVCNYTAVCEDILEHSWMHFTNRTLYEGNSLGDKATYLCLHGWTMFFKDGTNSSVIDVECLADGKWSREISSCSRDAPVCSMPRGSHSIPNGFLAEVSGNLPGDKAIYKCVPGYFFDEERTLTEKTILCKGNTNWSEKIPSCDYPIVCPDLPAVLFANLTRHDGNSLNNQAIYQCKEGFSMYFTDSTKSNVVAIHCGIDGKWSKDVSDCSPIVPQCPIWALSQTFTNGLVSEVAGNLPGHKATYQCTKGYFFDEERNITEMTVTCQGDGNWEEPAPSCKYSARCPNLPAVQNATLTQNDGQSLGDKVRFVCLLGTFMHFSDGIKREVVEIECGDDGKWSREVSSCTVDVPECVILSHTISNGFIYDFTGKNPGDQTTYRCNKGFFFDKKKTQTEKVLTCKGDGGWNEPIPSCPYAIGCNDLSTVQWLNRTLFEGHSLGDRAIFSCFDPETAMFFPDGTNASVVTIECEANGQWSRQLSICRKGEPICVKPPHYITNGFRYEATGTRPGDTVTYRCSLGFFLDWLRTKTEVTLTCRGDGSWDKSFDQSCKFPVFCPDLKDVDFAEKQRYDGHSLGNQAIFKCHPGFYMHFEDGTKANTIQIECEAEGKWSKQISFCTGDVPECPTHTLTITHGKLTTVTGNYPGDITVYECFSGYFFDEQRAVTKNTLTCQGDGQWNGPRPACTFPALCPVIQSIPNAAIIRYDGHELNDQAEYHCKEGYVFSTGETDNFVVIECEASGNWSRNITSCISEEEFGRIEAAKQGSNRSGLSSGGTAGVVIAVIIIALIVLAAAAGFVYYRRNYAPENKPSRFKNPAGEEEMQASGDVGLSVQNQSAAYNKGNSDC